MTVKNKAAKGRKGDMIIKNIFEEFLSVKFFVISAASKGSFDIVLSDYRHTFWIQSKFSRDWPPFDEEEMLCKKAGRFDLKTNTVLCCWIPSNVKGRYKDRLKIRKYYGLKHANGIQYLDYDEYDLIEFINYHQKLKLRLKIFDNDLDEKKVRNNSKNA